MTDNPQDRSEERRRTGRTGPLGEEPEETRRDPSTSDPSQDPSRETSQSPPEDEATRQIPADETRRSGALPRDPSSEETRQVETGGGTSDGSEDKETRVIRTPGSERRSSRRGERAGDTGSYPRGYFEAAEEREDRLRDMYGGIDWLASFLGFVFAAVAGGVLFSVLSLVIVPLGVSIEVGAEIGPAAITALVLLGVLIFLTFLFGGYVSGRLARFDGGRNGAMILLWTLIVGFLGFVIASFLPGAAGETMRDFLQGTVLPLVGEVLNLGPVGAIVAVAALLIALLGGMVGGRLGGRYHSEIDRTT